MLTTQLPAGLKELPSCEGRVAEGGLHTAGCYKVLFLTPPPALVTSLFAPERVLVDEYFKNNSFITFGADYAGLRIHRSRVRTVDSPASWLSTCGSAVLFQKD
jgi:hypothetical protein